MEDGQHKLSHPELQCENDAVIDYRGHGPSFGAMTDDKAACCFKRWTHSNSSTVLQERTICINIYASKRSNKRQLVNYKT
eukprot:s1402_g6.t1